MPDIDIVFNFVIHLNPALLLLIAGHLAQWVARAWQMIPDSAARPDGAHRQEARPSRGPRAAGQPALR